MQGVHGWIGPFDIVFAAYSCRGFLPVSFVFYSTSVSDRGFKCRLFTVQFSVKALKTLGNQYCNELKMPRAQAVYSFLYSYKNADWVR